MTPPKYSFKKNDVAEVHSVAYLNYSKSVANGSESPNNTRRKPVHAYESLQYLVILGKKNLGLEQ